MNGRTNRPALTELCISILYVKAYCKTGSIFLQKKSLGLFFAFSFYALVDDSHVLIKQTLRSVSTINHAML